MGEKLIGKVLTLDSAIVKPIRYHRSLRPYMYMCEILTGYVEFSVGSVKYKYIEGEEVCITRKELLDGRIRG